MLTTVYPDCDVTGELVDPYKVGFAVAVNLLMLKRGDNKSI
jgi:hypothetical protein